MTPSDIDITLRTSRKDHDALRRRLEKWLRGQMSGADITALAVPSGNGLSSETVLIDVVTTDHTVRRLVVRLAPDPAADPLFPQYDLALQFHIMQKVAEHTSTPVPRVLWLELDEDVLGGPFFVMERVEGEVPPDVMPYTFGGNWLFDASVEDQISLEQQTLQVVANLHKLSVSHVSRLFGTGRDDRSRLQRHVDEQRDYYAWVTWDGTMSPLIEDAFEWLKRHWPEEEGPAVLNWGDARIGNIVFRNFVPVAVLDWEMTCIGPRELDMGWMIYTHQFFQDLAQDAGLPGLPHLFKRSNVAATYHLLSQKTLSDLEFYTTYAALRHAIVMFRMARRQAHFGEAAFPANPDHAILYHAHLRRMLNGTYR